MTQLKGQSCNRDNLILDLCELESSRLSLLALLLDIPRKYLPDSERVEPIVFATKIFNWAESPSGCGLDKLFQKFEKIKDPSISRRLRSSEIFAQLKNLDFKDQIREFGPSLLKNEPKVLIVHSHSSEERSYCWLLKRFFFFSEKDETPEYIRLRVNAGSSSINNSDDAWKIIFDKLVLEIEHPIEHPFDFKKFSSEEKNSFDPVYKKKITNKISFYIAKLLSSKNLFFVLEGIEIMTENFIHDVINNFWIEIVSYLEDMDHQHRGRLFLFIIDSSENECHGVFRPGHPPTVIQWQSKVFISLSRTQAISKDAFTDWLYTHTDLFDDPETLITKIYPASTEFQESRCEIYKLIEELAKHASIDDYELERWLIL